MNDMPAATSAPAAAPDNAAPTDPNVTAAPGPEQTPEQVPEKTFTQKELDEILEKRLSKERRKREELSRRLQVTEELALRGRQEQPKAQPVAENGEPKRENFDSYEAFIEARAEWRADRKVEEKLAKNREQEAQTRTAEEQRKIEQQFRERAKETAKKFEDFDEVMESSDAPMTKAMAEAILHSDVGAEVAYHLAKNPGEAERIAALPAARQAAEIGRLEAKLSAPAVPTPKPSKAPAPIKPVGGKEVAGDDMPDPANTKAWIDWRNRQLMARRKGTQ